MVMKAIGKYKLLVFAALATMLLQVGAASLAAPIYEEHFECYGRIYFDIGQGR